MDALSKATYYLNVKPRTRQQVIKYLTDKGYDKLEIENAVASLEEYNYIDDESFTRLYFELGFEKEHGIARIKRELAGKGIQRELIEEVCNELMDQDRLPNQYQMALKIGNRIAEEGVNGITDLNNIDYDHKVKMQAKIARRLATRGFTSDIAYKVAKDIIK